MRGCGEEGARDEKEGGREKDRERSSLTVRAQKATS